MTKSEIKQTLIASAKQLKHIPSLDEFTKTSPVSHRQIVKHYGGYIAALRDTGLELKSVIGRGHAVPMDKLFLDWAGIVRKLKKIPSTTDYQRFSSYSTDPLMRRFRSWTLVPHGLKKFAQNHSLANKWKRELALVPAAPAPRIIRTKAEVHHHWPAAMSNRPLYGAPMWSWPMAYAPVNEFGVVFLFGAMAWQLGFVVLRLQAAFPDCEAMRRVGDDNCQLIKIEFEIESRNFRRHHHDPSKCDLIVCWEHNWPECPLEVLELRSYLPEQSFLPVSATLAMSHLPSTRTRLKRSVPQWSTLPSARNSNDAHTTARSLSMRTSGS